MTTANQKYYQVLGSRIGVATKQDILAHTLTLFSDDTFHQIVTPNTEMVMMSRHNKELREVLSAASVSLTDGIGLIWALRFLYGVRTERITGVDFVEEVIRELAISTKPKKVLFIGRNDGLDPESPQKAAKILQKKYPSTICKGMSFALDKIDCAAINAFAPDFLVVCFGVPFEELWISQHKSELSGVKVAIGAGGTADFIAGVQKRAPKIFRVLPLEWLWRLIKRPSRIRRQLAIPHFIILVIFSKFRLSK